MKNVLPMLFVAWFIWGVINPKVLCSTPWLYISLLPGAILVGLVYHSGYIKLVNGKPVRNILTGIILWVITSFFVLHAIPKTYGYFISSSAQVIELTVSSKSDTRRRPNRVSFTEWSCVFCELKIDADMWGSISVGDSVSVEGSNSWFGLIIYKVVSS